MPRISCRKCGWVGHYLGDHLVEKHGQDMETYQDKYPGAPLLSRELLHAWKEKSRRIRRQEAPSMRDLKASILDFEVPVYWDVPPSECHLRMPDFYHFPLHGKLSEDVRDALVSIISGRTTYIWGMPGSGKDALVCAYAASIRRPSRLFKVDPGEDIESWFFTRAIGPSGTYWEHGEFLKCLRDGYKASSGRVIPYLILISDIDRATPSQMESLRMVFDSIQGQVKGPSGKPYPVLPGSQILMTANTSGSGDFRGRSVSANPIDASILDRFERAYYFHWMDWKDEGPIVHSKFPVLSQEYPQAIQQVGKATEALRGAIFSGELYGEFSHRAVCSWLGNAQDILILLGKKKGLLRQSARCWLDKMADPETRTAALRIIDPFLEGGALDEGDTQHIHSTPYLPQ